MFDLDPAIKGAISIDIQSGVWPVSVFGWRLAALISKLDCSGKRVLDVGCGSGIQGIVAAKCGAMVSASDLSPNAAACTTQNARNSGVAVEVQTGAGLIPWHGRIFDLIICNGPTFDPVGEKSFASSPIAQRLRP